MNRLQFERHVRAYQDRVYAFACYYLGSREEAQDVTQEVLIRFWKHRDELEQERLLPWLLRVARNACIDQLRRRRSGSWMVSGREEALGAVQDESVEAPDRAAEAADFSERLRRHLDRMPDPYRSIVILREIQEMKYEEISGAMNLPLNTVKVYLHRGRKMLREQLREVKGETV